MDYTLPSNEQLDKMSEIEAETLIEELNKHYRSGAPVVSDLDYDALLDMFAVKFPKSKLLNQEVIESDTNAFEGKTVKLPERMFSTNKAYTIEALEKWRDSVVKVAKELNLLDKLSFKATPKLDGFAAYDSGLMFITRGDDGRKGTDISRVFDRGLLIELINGKTTKDRGFKKGEIVIDNEYFEESLSGTYQNSRNVISSIIKEGPLDAIIQNAIDHGGVVFKPFSQLEFVRIDYPWIPTEDSIDKLWRVLLDNCPFDTDGIVIEVVNEEIKGVMGNTNHHYRWQIAFKKNLEEHDIKVIDVIPQTSKNGILIPVVLLEPTRVSGVTISRATGHHYGNIIESRIGPGATVRVVRSGLVIPYIKSVTKPILDVVLPKQCLSCNYPTELIDNDLFCTNTETCPAQKEKRILFFFQTLGNCDGFGLKAIEQICSYGICSIEDIYEKMTADYLVKAGFGERTAYNLMDALELSKRVSIEDWRFLAAFSIHGIGRGGCEKLLKHHKLKDVFDLTHKDIIKIHGFAEKSADSLIHSLIRIKPAFDKLIRLGFNLAETPIGETIKSSIAGKTIVFTGSMQKGKRGDMERQAKQLGAKVGSSVSSNTDYLVCGTNVGASKIAGAKANNVEVITESDYLELIS